MRTHLAEAGMKYVCEYDANANCRVGIRHKQQNNSAKINEPKHRYTFVRRIYEPDESNESIAGNALRAYMRVCVQLPLGDA